jgi:hypothetical protein
MRGGWSIERGVLHVHLVVDDDHVIAFGISHGPSSPGWVRVRS